MKLGESVLTGKSLLDIQNEVSELVKDTPFMAVVFKKDMKLIDAFIK